MLGFRVCSPCRQPILYVLSNELGCELGVFLFIQGFSFLSGFLLTDAIQIDAAAAKLLKELGHEHHTGHFTNRYQVHFTSPCEFPQPEIVGREITEAVGWQLTVVRME